MHEALAAGAVEAHVVGGPAAAEFLALRGQLADQADELDFRPPHQPTWRACLPVQNTIARLYLAHEVITLVRCMSFGLAASPPGDHGL